MLDGAGIPVTAFKKTKKVELQPIESDTDRGPCLLDLDFELQTGQLVAVVGKVGSGKTSLLHAILGELERSSGVRNAPFWSQYSKYLNAFKKRSLQACDKHSTRKR